MFLIKFAVSFKRNYCTKLLEFYRYFKTEMFLLLIRIQEIIILLIKIQVEKVTAEVDWVKNE